MANLHIKSYSQFVNESTEARPVITISAYPNAKAGAEESTDETLSSENSTIYFEISGLPNISTVAKPIRDLTFFGEGMTQISPKTQSKVGDIVKGEVDGSQLNAGVIKTLVYHIKTGGKNLEEGYSLCAINYYDEALKRNKIAKPTVKFMNLNTQTPKLATLKPAQIAPTTAAPQKLAQPAQSQAQQPKKKFLDKVLGK
jgi:hypothetical protein